MPLFQVLTAAADEAAARALCEALERLEPAPVATEVRDHDDETGRWDAGGLFPAAPDDTSLALLAQAFGTALFCVERVEDRDWMAQVRAELTPVVAGRFVVHGGHDRAAVPVNRISLEIEAAQAFGTGHHASTQGCLTALDGLVRQGLVARRVADIGGGTGVLAMAACAIWPARATAGDIDPVATETARANVAANGLAARILCVTAAGFGHPLLHARAPYDLIFANILAAPLKRLAPDLSAHQEAGGTAILSGLLVRQAPGVAAVYAGWGYRVARSLRIGHWATLVLRRGG